MAKRKGERSLAVTTRDPSAASEDNRPAKARKTGEDKTVAETPRKGQEKPSAKEGKEGQGEGKGNGDGESIASTQDEDVVGGETTAKTREEVDCELAAARARVKELAQAKTKLARKEKSDAKTMVRGRERATPCMRCIRSLAHGRNDGTCSTHSGQGERCFLCHNHGHKCEEVPAPLLPFARELRRAQYGDNLEFRKIRAAWKVACQMYEDGSFGSDDTTLDPKLGMYETELARLEAVIKLGIAKLPRDEQDSFEDALKAPKGAEMAVAVQSYKFFLKAADAAERKIETLKRHAQGDFS